MTTSDDSQRERPYILIVREGPSHSRDDVLAACAIWAQRFSGEFWTFGSYDMDVTANGFRARVVAIEEKESSGNWRSYGQFAKQVLARARELRRAGIGPVVAIASDPFKNGLLVRKVANIVGGKCIIEINGAYGNAYAFSHIKNPLLRQARLLLFKLVGSFALSRAHGVRLLFDSQLDAFVVIGKKPIVRTFHELTLSTRFHNEPEQPFLLLVGYPFLVKGADLLIKAFMTIADRHPAWTLRLIGHHLKQSAEQHGLTHPRIEALPAMSQSELANWVARCGVLVQPSRTEAMGRILIEAAAAGKCRVAARVDGIPTVINDGVDGLLVEPNNVADLARILDKVLGDSELRHRLANAAQARSTQGFSQDAYLNNYSELIESVLGRKRL